ncbi:MAG: hypothetical protein ACI308_03670 [Muribaculaceae bacterium]
MKKYVLTLIGSLLLGAVTVQAQDYDDLYYDSGSSNKAKKTVKVKSDEAKVVGRTTYFNHQKVTPAVPVVADTATQVVNGRDVDEYNRRYADDADSYYAEEQAAYEMADTTNGDFTYTDRIVRFHNADVVIHSDDPDLIELYYDNSPQVNLIVGTPTTYVGWYNDPFYWDVYDPWLSWGWYRPYRFGLYGGWYNCWYDPWYSWGWHSWHCGWYDPWYSWGHPHYAWAPGPGWGHGLIGARMTDGGRLTSGYRRGLGQLPSGSGNSVGSGRPGYASTVRRGGVATGDLSSARANRAASGRATTISRSGNSSTQNRVSGSTVSSRPGTTGSIRRSVGADATSRMTERRSSAASTSRSSSTNRSYNTDRSSSYNSRSTSNYGSSSRSSSSYNSGSFSSGSHSSGVSSGGSHSSGGGRGGRR